MSQMKQTIHKINDSMMVILNEIPSEVFTSLSVSRMWFCGYVKLPQGHPWIGKEWSDFDVDVHGGITFTQDCKGKKNFSDGWWIGFDMSHGCDLEKNIQMAQSPTLMEARKQEAIAEVHKLSSQVAEAFSDGVVKDVAAFLREENSI